MKTNRFHKFLLAGITPWLAGAGLCAAPLTWFPGPALDAHERAATVLTSGRNFLTGGDVYEYYFFPVSYPISLAATNDYWTYYSPFYSLNIAPGAVVSDGNDRHLWRQRRDQLPERGVRLQLPATRRPSLLP